MRNEDKPIDFFLFQHAGANARSRIVTMRNFASQANFQIMDYPGRDETESENPIDSVEQVAAWFLQRMLPKIQSPIVLIGHSFGALVAYEVARQMNSRGYQPLHVFICASRRPNQPLTMPPIHHLPDDELLANLRQRTGNSVLANVDQRQRYLNSLRADIKAAETYNPENAPPLSSPITAIGGLKDRFRRADLALWSQYTINRFSLMMLPGGHFFINESPVRFIEYLNVELQVTLAIEHNKVLSTEKIKNTS